MNLDYTNQGRRPSARQIVSAWKKRGRPPTFSVVYGETYAQFRRLTTERWYDDGNGCRGVDRLAVVKLLEQQ